MKLHIDIKLDIEDCRLCPMCHIYYNSYKCVAIGKLIKDTYKDNTYPIPTNCPFKTNK